MVAEQIGHIDGEPPRLVFQSRLREPVVMSGEFGVELSDAVRRQEHDAARRAIAVVFGQMDDQAGAADLVIARKVRLGLMLPVCAEAQIADLELLGLGLIEDPKHRDGSFELHVFRPTRTPL